MSIGHVKAANQTIEDMKTKLAAKDLEGREAGTFLFITFYNSKVWSQGKSIEILNPLRCQFVFRIVLPDQAEKRYSELESALAIAKKGRLQFSCLHSFCVF